MKKLFHIVIGLVMYITNPEFRALVQAKLSAPVRGLDDTVQSGETVSAILTRVKTGEKITIGG